MLGIGITGFDDLQESLGNLPSGLEEVVRREVEWGLRRIQKEWKKIASGGGSSRRRRLKVRSGRYRSSIEIRFDRESASGSVGTSVVYAKTLEFGATIRPKRKKWLAIPLAAALTPSGVARGKPRDFRNTFFARSRSGNLILFQKTGSRVRPLFVMKKRVRIRARRPAGRAQSTVEPIIYRRFDDKVSEFIKGSLQ